MIATVYAVFADAAEAERIAEAVVEERLAAHNELEEKQIYGLMGSILSEEEQAQLASQINEELLKHPPRFTADTWLG